MTILFAPASKHPQDLRSLVAQPMMRFLFSLQALFDGCKGILPCLWPTGRYRPPASLFLNVFTTERGRKDEERDIRQPQNLQRIGGLRSFFTGVSDASSAVYFLLLSAAWCTTRPAPTPPLQTLHIDSLLIIYRAGRRVCRHHRRCYSR